ncbi:MAG: iron-sulfur cluster assembly scaffold protein [Planctomycetota bacterium]
MPHNEEIDEDHVLDHYQDPYHRGDCEQATHADNGESPLCGDSVRVSLQLSEDGVVREAWFDGEGCVISQASASMLVERIEGMTFEEAEAFSAHEMLELFGPSLTPNRRKCCLLGWRVMQSALHSPIDSEWDEDGPQFGGPSLSEES